MNSETTTLSEVQAHVVDRRLSSKLLLLLCISLFVLISLHIFLFAPLYIYFANDILYKASVLPEILSLLSSVVDILVVGIFNGVILYSIYRFSLKKSIRLLVAYGTGILYKYLGNLLMTYLTDGIPADITEDLLDLLRDIGLEYLQAAAVVIIGTVIMIRAKKREAIRREAAVIARKTYSPTAEYLPFTKLLRFKNPIQKAAFWMASVSMVVQIAQRIVYDVWYTVTFGFYGNVLSDVLWMILYYTLDIIGYGIVVYLVMLFILTHYHKLNEMLIRRISETSIESILPE